MLHLSAPRHTPVPTLQAPPSTSLEHTSRRKRQTVPPSSPLHLSLHSHSSLTPTISHYTKQKPRLGRVAARMDVESTEAVAISQMKLLRRCRYCAPIAENKRNSAGLKNHLGFNHTSCPSALQPVDCKS